MKLKEKLRLSRKRSKKVGLEELIKEKEDIESMIAYLESEYRKANISEKSYSELKKKHLKRLEDVNKKLGVKDKPKKVGKEVKKKEEVEKEGERKKKIKTPSLSVFAEQHLLKNKEEFLFPFDK